MFNKFDKLRECKKCNLITNDRHAFLDHLIIKHDIKFACTAAVYELDEELPEFERVLPWPEGMVRRCSFGEFFGSKRKMYGVCELEWLYKVYFFEKNFFLCLQKMESLV